MIFFSYFMDEKLVFNAQDEMIATFSVDVIGSAISMIESRNNEKDKKEKARSAQQESVRILQLLEEIRGPKSEKY